MAFSGQSKSRFFFLSFNSVILDDQIISMVTITLLFTLLVWTCVITNSRDFSLPIVSFASLNPHEDLTLVSGILALKIKLAISAAILFSILVKSSRMRYESPVIKTRMPSYNGKTCFASLRERGCELTYFFVWQSIVSSRTSIDLNLLLFFFIDSIQYLLKQRNVRLCNLFSYRCATMTDKLTTGSK